MRRMALLFLCLLPCHARAASASQTMTIGMDVQEIVLLSFSIPDVIALDIGAPAAAGLAPTSDTTHATVRLRYTSCAAPGQTRKIQVNFDPLDPGRPPSGTALRVVANPMPTNVGTAAAAAVVTEVAKDFITNIGSCNTGTSATSGPRIRYTFAVTDAAALAQATVTVTVVYTITDAS